MLLFEMLCAETCRLRYVMWNECTPADIFFCFPSGEAFIAVVMACMTGFFIAGCQVNQRVDPDGWESCGGHEKCR